MAPHPDPARAPRRRTARRTRPSPPAEPLSPELLVRIAAAVELVGGTASVGGAGVVHRIGPRDWHGTPSARPACGTAVEPTRLQAVPGPVTCKRCSAREARRDTQEALPGLGEDALLLPRPRRTAG